MKRLLLFFFPLCFSSVIFAMQYDNFYLACINLDPDAIAAMRWVHAYYDTDEPANVNKKGIKLECGKAYAYLSEVTDLKLNYDPHKLQCPDSNCKLHSMEFVRYFDNLQSIELNGHRIADLSPASELPNLVYLSLEDNLIKDIAPLISLAESKRSLKVLNLHENLVTDLTPVQNFTHLKALDVSRNRLTSLPDLSMLHELNMISLNFNNLNDFSSIANNKNLQILEMSNTSATSLATLGQTLSKLTFLDAHFNQLTDIKSLEAAENLEELNITHNQISDIRSLNILGKLRDAEIGGNQVTYDQCMNMLRPRSDREHICISIKHWNDRF